MYRDAPEARPIWHWPAAPRIRIDAGDDLVEVGRHATTAGLIDRAELVLGGLIWQAAILGLNLQCNFDKLLLAFRRP